MHEHAVELTALAWAAGWLVAVVMMAAALMDLLDGTIQVEAEAAKLP